MNILHKSMEWREKSFTHQMQVPNKCYLTFITAKISQRKSSVQNMCKTNQKKKNWVFWSFKWSKARIWVLVMFLSWCNYQLVFIKPESRLCKRVRCITQYHVTWYWGWGAPRTKCASKKAKIDYEPHQHQIHTKPNKNVSRGIFRKEHKCKLSAINIIENKNKIKIFINIMGFNLTTSRRHPCCFLMFHINFHNSLNTVIVCTQKVEIAMWKK